jgi:hypothetical protein
MLDKTKLTELRARLSTLPDAIVESAAHGLRADIQVNWSATAPSAPGSSPAIRSGALSASVMAVPMGGGHWQVLAGGSAAPYAALLEYGSSTLVARPFMRPAVDRLSLDSLGRIFFEWMKF